jgi:hypothetical protein
MRRREGLLQRKPGTAAHETTPPSTLSPSQRSWGQSSAGQERGGPEGQAPGAGFGHSFAQIDVFPPEHASEAPAHDLASSASAGPAADAVVQRKAAPEASVFSAEEGAEIQNRWSTEGSLTVKDSNREKETTGYYAWRAKARAAIAKVKKSAGKTRADELGAWITAFEAREKWALRRAQSQQEPADPGALPEELQAVGAPPSPAFRIQNDYDVKLPGEQEHITYRDYPVSPSYQYLLDPSGVAHAGTKVGKRSNIDSLLAQAGISDPVAQKVMKKVSTEEGGFEAVNTYDTGYVSVGFIQFISGKTGNGSLADVLRRMKSSNPAEFATYFHSLGIDVDSKGVVVVDPASGQVLRGEAAVSKIMADKRLTAVFQHAGDESSAFQVAQLQQAHQTYYMANKSFEIKVASLTDTTNPTAPAVKYFYGKNALKDAKKAAGKDPKKVVQSVSSISGTYGEVLTSEAGKTAIMDRAVQRGVGSAQKEFEKACAAILAQHQLLNKADLVPYERQIIPSVQNRIHVLQESDLSQPN